MIRLKWYFVVTFLLVMTGCTSAPQASPVTAAQPTAAAQEQVMASTHPTIVASPALPTQHASASTSTALTCPVTLPNGSTPPREDSSIRNHGNGTLWTVLKAHGIIRASPEDVGYAGSVAVKFPWWRGPSVHGQLTIEGRRLDGPAPPLQAWIPDGYGDTGFQSTALTFPTEGCWKITGKAGNATLTFVTFVVKEQT